jgi:hypothetical protein
VVLYIFVVLTQEERQQRKREKRQAAKARRKFRTVEDAWMDYVRANYDSPVGVEVAYTITNDFWTLPVAKVTKVSSKKKISSSKVVKQPKTKVSCPIKEKLTVLQTSSRLSILRAAWKRI